MKNIRQPVRTGIVPAVATPASIAEPLSSAAAPATAADNTASTDDQVQAAADTDVVAEDVEGRVVVAFDDYRPNDIFVGSAEDALALEGELKIDCDPKAVAYAKSLGQG